MSAVLIGTSVFGVTEVVVIGDSGTVIVDVPADGSVLDWVGSVGGTVLSVDVVVGSVLDSVVLGIVDGWVGSVVCSGCGVVVVVDSVVTSN